MEFIKPMLCIDDIGKFKKHTPLEYAVYQDKLDGVRVLIHYEDGKVIYYSRNHKIYNNFHKFDRFISLMAEDIKETHGISEPIIFDGEVVDKTGEFQKVMTQVRRLENVNPDIFQLHLFDIVLNEEYYKRETILYQSWLEIKWWLQETECVNDEELNVFIVNSFDLQSYDDEYLKEILQKVINSGFEGVVLKNVLAPYEFKRSNYWCKIKEEKTIDIPVVDVVEGKGKYQGMLGALICKLPNGKEIKIGSGFTDKEREEFWENPPKLIDVKYQGLTKGGSLRFPVFLRVRDDK